MVDGLFLEIRFLRYGLSFTSFNKNLISYRKDLLHQESLEETHGFSILLLVLLGSS
jgi:hypothetical protein